MKRPHKDDSPNSPEFQAAVAATFKADRKRRAGDICKKGTNGTGYIEGKVYERGTIGGDTWEFTLTVELGSRAHVLLSGTVSKYFHDLPIAVGAQVRLDTRGLVLEDLPAGKCKSLVLGKRFEWRDEIIIHVRGKTGQEAFFNTWEGHETRAASVPQKRQRITPPPVSPRSNAPETLSLNAPDVIGERAGIVVAPILSAEPDLNAQQTAQTNGVIPLKPGDSMDVDPPRPAPVVAAATPQESAKSQNSSKDSQNPQSLPSPPPEVLTARESGERSRGEEAPVSRDSRKPSSSRLEPRPQSPGQAVPSHDPDDQPRAAQAARHQQNAQAGPSRTAPPPATRLSSKEKKKIREKDKQKRKIKQLGKAGKLLPEPRADIADRDSDDDYWAGGNYVPDELLFEIDEQGVTERTGSKRGSATPAPGPPPEPPAAVDKQLLPSAEKTSLPVPTAAPPPVFQHPSSPARSQPPEPSSQRQSPTEDQIDPIESLRSGCACPASCGTYTPLVDFQGVGTKNIMGVVSSAATIGKTKTGEFIVRFELHDPTNIASSGLNVTLFEKTQRALPEPAAGDIILLRSITGDRFNSGTCAVGPSFRGWQWAIFHVKTAKFSIAPQEGGGRHFRPETIEIQYSIRLGDWWRDVSANMVSFSAEPSISTRSGRLHKLLSETDDVGYFDCTVEILHGYPSGDNTYTVFVTDYTHNAGVTPVQANWCPPKLAEVAVQVELWDSSSTVGPTMQVGEYYSIRNMRLKRGGGGFLEGRMQEANKIKKLDEDELEGQPHLVELLKRKKEWETNAKLSGGMTEFPHQLIEEVEENRHFSCTVEVVHISSKDAYSYLYVTDYTSRTDLVPVSPAIAPGHLTERVVRIALNDAQVEIGMALEAGDFIAILNLRLYPASGGALLCGRLGGEQRLINKLNPKATGNKELRELLRRKEAFEEAVQAKSKPGKKRAARQAEAEAEAAAREQQKADVGKPCKGKERAAEDHVSLADVKASGACPAVFRVRARVVDFFPDDLRECTALRCTNCDTILPKMHRMCAKCDDAMESQTFAQAFFQLYFRLADEEGDTLEVSVADERCSVLQDLEPADVHEDVDGAFDMFVSRVRPLLGDVLEVSDGEARRSSFHIEDESCGSMLSLTLGSWLPDGEPDTPDSRGYIVLRHFMSDSDT